MLFHLIAAIAVIFRRSKVGWSANILSLWSATKRANGFLGLFLSSGLAVSGLLVLVLNICLILS